MIGQLIGNYRLLRVLGEGGMGIVYEAVREDIGSSAAIKILKKEYALQPEVAARFFNEARAVNLVNHPGIVKVFDYGQLPSGAAFLAMEYLEGESLHHRLRREVRLSEPESLRLGRQIASALAAAHDKQVIHRDLKPDNILIVPDTEAAGDERAKVLDFGIAKLTDSQQGPVRTQTNMLMGTPIYMSPEQCRGSKSIGDRTDVYSLGVMIFEMLSGRTPFVGEEPGEYIGQHIYKEPPHIGSLVPSLTPALQRLVESMLLKEPQSRPSMVAVARVLKEIGNLSSDVVSVRALVDAHAETVPRLRAARPQPPAPAAREENPAAGGALPVPPSDNGVASSPQTSSSRDGSVALRPAAELTRDMGAALHAAASTTTQEDETQILGQSSFPEVGTAFTKQDTTVNPSWQTLNVMKMKITEGNLSAAALNADRGAVHRRIFPPGRLLRRLQVRLRRRIHHLLGIPILVAPGSLDEQRLVRFRNWVLVIGGTAILALIAALLCRL